MSSRKNPIHRASLAMGNIFLADELLEEIFLRLASPADLVRVSIACVTFRRVITDRSFLRHYRSLHKPPLLGFLHKEFFPAEPPHPSARVARALAQAADFTFSFLRRRVSHLHGPFVSGAEAELVPVDERNSIADLAICDPISRCYTILPFIPETRTACIEERRVHDFEAFLAPAGEEEMADTSFRVMARVHYGGRMIISVFSSRTGEWCAFEFGGCSALAMEGILPRYVHLFPRRQFFARLHLLGAVLDGRVAHT